MPMQSFGECPWCGARIDLLKEDRVWVCPVCSCTFTRNSAKWKVGIPAAIGVAILPWIFGYSHAAIASCLGAMGVLIFTAKASHHEIVSGGRTDLAVGEAKKNKPKGKESKWFIVAVVVLLLAVLLGLGFILIANH